MKKQKGIFLLLLMGLLLLSTLSLGAPTGVKAEQVTEKPKGTKALPTTIKMGGVFPIVKRPDAGRDRRDAFLLAVYEINNQTGPDRILPVGVTIQPLVKDDDNSAAGGTAAAQALIAEGADIVIGSSGSSVSAAMASELTPHKIVQISYASSSPALSDRTLYPYFMRVAASDADQGEALFDLVKAFKWTKGATIHTDDSYGTGLVEVFTEYFENVAYGGTMLTDQQFAPDATDVAAQIQAIKDANPEFVLGNFIDTDAATAFKKARDLDALDMPWIITDGSSTTATFAGDASVKEAMQLFIGTTPAPLTGAGYAAFNATWFDPANDFLEGPKNSQDTGTVFNSYAPLAYDAVYVAAKGLAEADSVEGDTLLPELYNVTHSGASGDIVFNDLGEVIGRYDYVVLINETYHTFGEWQDGATFSPLDLKGLLPELLGVAPVATPGFSGLELLFSLILGVVILEVVRRKRR